MAVRLEAIRDIALRTLREVEPEPIGRQRWWGVWVRSLAGSGSWQVKSFDSMTLLNIHSRYLFQNTLYWNVIDITFVLKSRSSNYIKIRFNDNEKIDKNFALISSNKEYEIVKFLLVNMQYLVEVSLAIDQNPIERIVKEYDSMWFNYF